MSVTYRNDNKFAGGTASKAPLSHLEQLPSFQAIASPLRWPYEPPAPDEMDHRAFALDFAAHRHHACREYNASLSFEQRGPDHQVSDTGLVLDGDGRSQTSELAADPRPWHRMFRLVSTIGGPLSRRHRFRQIADLKIAADLRTRYGRPYEFILGLSPCFVP